MYRAKERSRVQTYCRVYKSSGGRYFSGRISGTIMAGRIEETEKTCCCDVHQMPVIIYHNHPPKTIEVENKDFKEFVQKRTSAK